jgi:hypothetical protein
LYIVSLLDKYRYLLSNSGTPLSSNHIEDRSAFVTSHGGSGGSSRVCEGKGGHSSHGVAILDGAIILEAVNLISILTVDVIATK